MMKKRELGCMIWLSFFMLLPGCGRRSNYITSIIEYEPYHEESFRAGIDSSHEIIYLNKNSDPDFFDSIVKSVENWQPIKENNCRKSNGKIKVGRSLPKKGLSAEDITETVIFRGTQGRLTCYVSNGINFVIIIIWR